MKKIGENLKVFFIAWGVVLVLNQVLLFHACFHSYCIAAALPHTGIIAGILTYLMSKDNTNA